MTVTVETTKAGCYVDVTPATLERLVQQASEENLYLIVTRDDREGFAQAHVWTPKSDGRRRFLVEYREDANSPMHSTELVIDRAIGVLLGWAFDRPGWTSGIRWRKEKLESKLDLRGQCAFSDAPGGGRECRLSGSAEECAPNIPEVAVVWDLVGEGATDELALSEFFTRMAVFMNGADANVRVAWGTWLGKWLVKVPRDEAERQWHLDEDQLRRIEESGNFKSHWPDGASLDE